MEEGKTGGADRDSGELGVSSPEELVPRVRVQRREYERPKKGAPVRGGASISRPPRGFENEKQNPESLHQREKDRKILPADPANQQHEEGKSQSVRGSFTRSVPFQRMGERQHVPGVRAGGQRRVGKENGPGQDYGEESQTYYEPTARGSAPLSRNTRSTRSQRKS